MRIAVGEEAAKHDDQLCCLPFPNADFFHSSFRTHHVRCSPVACRAKLSDMGLSKRLVPEQISFESVGSGGSSGWQAPEQLISRSGGTARQTSSGEHAWLWRCAFQLYVRSQHVDLAAC